MKKKIVALGILSALLFSSAVYADDYWTGDGGKGVNLAVLIPEGRGLSADQAYLPTIVQGVFVTDLKKYSAMSVIDQANLDKVLKVTESGIYREEDFVKLGEINADHSLTGSLIKTSSGFSLQIQITGLKDGKIKASYSGACTVAEFDNHVAIKRASLALLEGMGISLTAQARTELQQAAAQQTRQAQEDMAKANVALRNDATTEARHLLYTVDEIDPSMGAANRLSIIAADIRTGNIGQDMRNDIQWNKDWDARLVETERYFDTFFKTFNQPYALIYTPELQTGTIDTINRKDETNWVRFTVELREQSNWTNPVLKTVNDVWQDLNATGRKTAWGFADWPRSRRSNVNPFTNGSKRLTIVVELLNDQQKVIGQQTFTEQGSWAFSFNQNLGIQSFTSSGEAAKTITFPAVKVADWTDKMTLRFTTVNNVPVADASKNGLLMITTRALYRDAAGFNYDGGGYSWDGYDKVGYDRDGFNRVGYDRDGFNRVGYDTDGYDRDGFNRVGYDRAGYDRDGYGRDAFNRDGYGRDGFDSRGFNKEGYTVDGSLYDKEGYDRDGYDKKGYNWGGYNKYGYDKKGYSRDGYNRYGFRKWSPVSSYFEALYTFRLGLPGGFMVGIFGAYGSFSFNAEPTGTYTNDDGEETTKYDVSLGEFVVGYTLNILTNNQNGWGLGLPLGVGFNRLERQLVLETGLQLRLYIPSVSELAFIELRGTYRTIGFRDNSFTISAGWCLWF